MKKIVLVVFAMIFGLSMNAQDKKETKMKPTVKINGRIQYDFIFANTTEDDVDDKSFNGNEFRRAYISAKGKLGKKVSYKAELEFAGGDVAYRDVWIKYNAGKLGSIAFGSMAEGTGLDMATSSKYTTFLERAIITNFQNFRWQSGIHYMNYNLFDKGITLQMAMTNNGNHKDGFKDKELEKGINYTFRTTYAFVLDNEKHNFIHLGVNYDKRQNGGEVKFKPENHMVGGVSLGFGDGSLSRSDIGMELATNFGSLSVQGEYKSHSNEMPLETYKVNVFYAQASYFITGEHRPYKKGTFGRVKPKNTVDNGGFGALEVAARYSAVDNSDFVTTGYNDGLTNITLGLNWYLNSHARVMYNYAITDYQTESNKKMGTHMFRVAIDF